MKIIADLHIHTKYSRCCAKKFDLEENEKWGLLKGVNLIGTGDFTHPAWFSELKEKLEPSYPGLYKLKHNDGRVCPVAQPKTDGIGVNFILSTEISCIYKQDDKCRRIHICLLMPSLESVEKLIANFKKRGFNITSDGRPIIGLSAYDLAKIVLEIDDRALIIPAHIWTPWFALFGSKSGFDTIEECFKELAPRIHAVETGLSSNPPMNWRLSALDNITLLSNSDAHSPANIGREANVFKIEENKYSYNEIYDIIKTGDQKRFLYTINFFPEEGRYHYDGHDKCDYSCEPSESVKQKNICPVCKKGLTLGVDHRVNELADRESDSPNNHIGYKSLIPLDEIIADHLRVGKKSKKVQNEYIPMIAKYPELDILMDLSLEKLQKITAPEIAQNIISVREGKVNLIPGFDGRYGKIKIKGKKEKPKQKKLI